MHGSVERKIKIPELLIFGHRRRLGFCIPLWLFSFCIWDMDISYDHDRIVVVDLPMLQCLNASCNWNPPWGEMETILQIAWG